MLKFAGHFHGWHDQLIPAGDPPSHDAGDYSMPGVTEGVFGDLVIVPAQRSGRRRRAPSTSTIPRASFTKATAARWGVVPTPESSCAACGN